MEFHDAPSQFQVTKYYSIDFHVHVPLKSTRLVKCKEFKKTGTRNVN